MPCHIQEVIRLKGGNDVRIKYLTCPECLAEIVVTATSCQNGDGIVKAKDAERHYWPTELEIAGFVLVIK